MYSPLLTLIGVDGLHVTEVLGHQEVGLDAVATLAHTGSRQGIGGIGVFRAFNIQGQIRVPGGGWVGGRRVDPSSCPMQKRP